MSASACTRSMPGFILSKTYFTLGIADFNCWSYYLIMIFCVCWDRWWWPIRWRRWLVRGRGSRCPRWVSVGLTCRHSVSLSTGDSSSGEQRCTSRRRLMTRHMSTLTSLSVNIHHLLSLSVYIPTTAVSSRPIHCTKNYTQRQCTLPVVSDWLRNSEV